MKIFVIILHFGDMQTTKQCIAGLLAHESFPFSLIVVNNMTEKFTPRDFSHTQITVINNEKNLGFSGGVNKGIQIAVKSGADVVILLNNDTEIKKPFIKTLIKPLQSSYVGIAAPAISFHKNSRLVFDIGGKINTLFWRTSHNEVPLIKQKNVQPVDYVSGCCMAIKKSVIQKTGIFDEHFFLYFEDADYCLRAKRQGFATVVVPSVTIRHMLSKTVGKMSRVAIVNLLKSGKYFGKKYAKNPMQKFANRLYILVQAVLFFRATPSAWDVIAKALFFE